MWGRSVLGGFGGRWFIEASNSGIFQLTCASFLCIMVEVEGVGEDTHHEEVYYEGAD